MRWVALLALCSLLAGGQALAADESRPPIINTNPTASTPGVPNEFRPPPALPPNATVQQPRSFGYVIGDVFTQRVLLMLNGTAFEPAELPIAGRAGVWFERRAIRIEKDSSGRRWLAIDYQLMNSPQTLAVATLPAWKLTSKPPANTELRVAEWPMTVAPLTPEKPLLGVLRPDRPAALVDLATIERLLATTMVLLIATLAAWAGWWAWRNWRASTSQPFALALRHMRNVDDTAPEAWLALHRAFDSTAGRALRVESLAAWLDRTPKFQSLRPAIEKFFGQSASRFFAGQPVEQPVSVHALCRDLRRIEKRHES